MENTRTLLIQFKNELSAVEVPLFRGAVIQALDEDDVLFHNHHVDGTRYSYPLIQYKAIRGKAALMCLNEGIDSVSRLFEAGHPTMAIGRRIVRMEVERTEMRRFNIEPVEHPVKYVISDWLALNKENHLRFLRCDSLEEQVAMLEAILRGNILSMCKCLRIAVNVPLVCTLLSRPTPIPAKFKHINMLSFNAEFEANISLPDYIGLGKNASTNHGTIVRLS